MKTPRIPKSVNFGFGFRSPVVFREQIRGKDGEYQVEGHRGPQIDINGSSNLIDQIEAYGHEVVHAAIDFNRWLMQEVVGPLREEALRTEMLLKKEKE